jgi:hypothetical protein
VPPEVSLNSLYQADFVLQYSRLGDPHFRSGAMDQAAAREILANIKAD